MTTPTRIARLRLFLLAVVLAVVAAPLAALPAHAADPVTLNLLTMNDFHGRIDPNITVKFAGTVEQLRAQAGDDNSLLVSAGDNVSASLFASAVQGDQPTIDVLNALHLDVSAVGNHEFDKGYADLVDRIIDGGSNAAWPYLGANVYEKGTTTPALPEYAIIDKAGLKIGVIGAVTQETSTLVSPAGIAQVDFGDPVTAVNRVAAELTDGDASNGEADLLVASYHEGADNVSSTTTLDQAIAANPVFAEIVNQTSPKVAAIVTGHTHQKYAFSAPIPGETGTRPVIQTGNYGDNVGQIKLSVDPETKSVTSFTVANVPRVTTDDATLVATYPRVAKVKPIVDAALVYAAQQGNQPVGSITADITTAYTNGTRDDRGSESTLGNTVANALRDKLSGAAVGGAQIGVVNPGGLRAELSYKANASNPADADGRVLYAEANAVLPFVNNLWTTTLTGAQFVTMLEQQWQRAPEGQPAPSRAFLNLGLSDNVSYTYHEVPDPADGNANRTKGVIDTVTIDGKPLDPAGKYRIGTFSFLTSGGDNFRVLAQGSDARDSGLIDRDAWIGYLQDHPNLAPSFARRAVKITDQPVTATEGDRVDFTLSKLDLTSLGSPKNTGIEVFLKGSDGVERSVGSTTVSDGVAEIVGGRAPAAGAYTVILRASPSGTTVQFPLTVQKAVPPPTVRATATPSATDRERVVVTVTVTNTDSVPLDLKLSTAWGEASFEQVAPGATVRKAFATGASSIGAGAATVSATKTVDGRTASAESSAPYAALIATLSPRGYVQTKTALNERGQVVFTAYFVNLGGDPVMASLSTAYGSGDAAVTVRPLRTGTLTLNTDEQRTRRTVGTVTATKTIGGRTFTSTFDAVFPATR